MLRKKAHSGAHLLQVNSAPHQLFTVPESHPLSFETASGNKIYFSHFNTAVDVCTVNRNKGIYLFVIFTKTVSDFLPFITSTL